MATGMCPAAADDIDALFGEAPNTHRTVIGLTPAGRVRDYAVDGRPWTATDPVLGGPWHETPGLDVVRTGARLTPGARPLPAGPAAFLEAGEPPMYVGFGSRPMHAPTDVARVAGEAIRAQGRRVLVVRGRADLTSIDDERVGAAHDGPTPAVATPSAAPDTAPAPTTRTKGSEVAAVVRTDDGTVVAAKLLLDAIG